MFVKLSARRVSSAPQVHIRTAPFELSEWNTSTSEQLDLFELLLERQLLVDAPYQSHHLTYFCQHLYHNNLDAYLADRSNRSAARGEPFLSPVRGLRLVRDYADVDTLDLAIAAHTALAFALRSAADAQLVSAHSARDLFDAVAECVQALNASDFQRARGAHRLAEPAAAWRLEALSSSALLPTNTCFESARARFPRSFESDRSAGSRGAAAAALLLLVDVNANSRRPTGAHSDFLEARLVLDARALAAPSHDSSSSNGSAGASSNVRALQRSITIAAHMAPASGALLLRLTLIASIAPHVEQLGPFDLVSRMRCQTSSSSHVTERTVYEYLTV